MGGGVGWGGVAWRGVGSAGVAGGAWWRRRRGATASAVPVLLGACPASLRLTQARDRPAGVPPPPRAARVARPACVCEHSEQAEGGAGRAGRLLHCGCCHSTIRVLPMGCVLTHHPTPGDAAPTSNSTLFGDAAPAHLGGGCVYASRVSTLLSLRSLCRSTTSGPSPGWPMAGAARRQGAWVELILAASNRQIQQFPVHVTNASGPTLSQTLNALSKRVR
jgi:hypothetical protein